MTSEAMREVGAEYVRDASGKPTAVILSIDRYEQLLEEVEELSDLVTFLEARAAETEFVPLASARPNPKV
jgi:PHD/YefM family antitoxin component YafN of YafNO toxin-antitoxin module